MIYKPISAGNGNPGIAPTPSTFRKWIAKLNSLQHNSAVPDAEQPGSHFKASRRDHCGYKAH